VAATQPFSSDMATRSALVKVFVGSAREDLPYATAFKAIMEEDGGLKATVWKDAFRAGETILAGLDRLLAEYDFGVFLLRNVDLVIQAEKETAPRAPSANVVLEFGMFYARLGRRRVFVACPTDPPNLPSDLGGLIVRTYNPDPANPGDAVRVAAHEARQLALAEREAPREAAAAPRRGLLDGLAPDGWRRAVKEGWLEQVDESMPLEVGDEVIDAVAGWGLVAGIRLGVRGERVAIVALPGDADIEVAVVRLYRPRPT
jgi:hypothetical protein